MDVPEGPLLSVVVTSRNDNHGEGLLRRMQTFVNAFIGQCRRHQLNAELVIVEWNPPAGRPRLAQALRWPADPGPCTVRIIEVPESLHRRFRHAEALPLFQMIGKNVGIRRARGKFVLATNIDIILNDELVRFIAAGQLQAGRMYRLDRHDVMADVPVDAPVEEQLDYCATHLLRTNRREGTFPLLPDGQHARFPIDVAGIGEDVTLEEGWFPVEWSAGQPHRWAGAEAVIAVRPPTPAHRSLRMELAPGPGVDHRPFRMQVLDRDGQTVGRYRIQKHQEIRLPLSERPDRTERFRLRVLGGGWTEPHDPRVLNFRICECGWPGQIAGQPWGLRVLELCQRAARRARHYLRRLYHMNVPEAMRVGRRLARWTVSSLRRGASHLRRAASRFWPRSRALSPAFLHTNACGDFTLMAREHWFELRGNPEFEMFSMHIDSLMCYVAHHGGAVEEVLPEPMRIYHIEHGSGWTPEGGEQLLQKVAAKGISVLDYQQVYSWAAQMRAEKRPIQFNDASWGLDGESLPETVIAGAA